MSKEVIIVGCGPAGLLSAWAAESCGFKPVILGGSSPAKSVIHGAQYLHSEIPGLTDISDAFVVTYYKVGTPEQYVRKVYGEGIPVSRSSWYKFEDGRHLAYPLHEMYDRLWNHYESKIYSVEFNSEMARVMKVMTGRNVICSAPLDKIAPWMRFTTETVSIVSGVAEPEVGLNEIYYYGDDRRCYRSSNILGHKSTEYPGHEILTGGALVKKPLRAHGATIPHVDLVGRYGLWAKGVLVDEAYSRTVHLLGLERFL